MEAQNNMKTYSSRGGKRYARGGLTDELLGMSPDEFGD